MFWKITLKITAKSLRANDGPDSTKPLPEPVLTYQRGPVAITWEQCHKKCSWT